MWTRLRMHADSSGCAAQLVRASVDLKSRNGRHETGHVKKLATMYSTIAFRWHMHTRRPSSASGNSSSPANVLMRYMRHPCTPGVVSTR